MNLRDFELTCMKPKLKPFRIFMGNSLKKSWFDSMNFVEQLLAPSRLIFGCFIHSHNKANPLFLIVLHVSHKLVSKICYLCITMG